MITEKYSINNFKRLDKSSAESKTLHNDLEKEIAAYLHQASHAAFQDIIRRLNKLGHNLQEIEPEFDPEYCAFDYEAVDSSTDDTPRIWYHSQLGALTGYFEEDK